MISNILLFKLYSFELEVVSTRMIEMRNLALEMTSPFTNLWGNIWEYPCKMSEYFKLMHTE